MAIGDIRSQIGTPRQSVSAVQGGGTALSAMGQGVGRALTVLASDVLQGQLSLEQLRQAQKERQKQKDSFDVEQRWVRWQTDEATRYAEMKRTAPPDGTGFTNLADQEAMASATGFLATVPPELQPEYKVLVEKYRNQRVVDAYSHEVNLSDAAAVTGISDTLTSLGTSLGAGQIDLDGAEQQLNEVIERSVLPPVKKEELKANGRQALASLQFSRDMEKLSMGRGTVREANEGDVVAAGLNPVQRTILNVIAGPESGGRYDVRNGGTSGTQTITDFSDHPRTRATTADGTPTSAAGRYQFIEGTWDDAVAYAATQGVIVTDFSPESQDRVAALWAPKRYRDLSGGRDLYADLSSGDFDTIANVRRVLGGGNGRPVEWEGFQHLSDFEFVEKVQAGLQEGGTGTPDMPDVWNDPRYASIPLDQKVQMSGQVQTMIGQKQAAMIEATQAADKARQDALFDSAYMGQTTIDHIPMLWANGQIVSVADEQRVRQGIAAYQEKAASIADTSLRIENGEPFSPKDAAVLDNWVGEAGAAGIRGMDTGETRRVLSGLARAGRMAPVVDATFSQMLHAGTVQERAFALEQLANLQRANPRALVGSEVLETFGPQIALYGAVADRFASSEETYAAIAQGQEIHKGKAPAAIRKESEDLFAEAYKTPRDVRKLGAEVAGRWAAPITEDGTQLLHADLQEAFHQGYALTGTEEGAIAFAKQSLKETWAVSELNGGKMMKWAPEALYPQVNGDHGWMRQQLEEELALPPGASFEVLPGQQTEEEYLAYSRGQSDSLPTYNVLITWPNGEVSARVGWYGEPERVRDTQGAWEERTHLRNLYLDLDKAESPEDRAAIQSQIDLVKGRRNAVPPSDDAGIP